MTSGDSGHVATSAWILWRNREGGAERFRLERSGAENRLNGVVITPLEGDPAEIRYLVTADAQWRTTSCHVVVNGPAGSRRFHLLARDGSWFTDDGAEVPELRDCVDVDLMCTPATNTLVIRRSGLAVGETIDVKAAWVRFPGLDVSPTVQRYTRLSDYRWLYESDTFRAEIAVDADGLVVDYADVWTSVARWSEPRP